MKKPDYKGGFTIPESALDSVSQLSDVLPDFDHQIFYTNVMVHTTHNKAFTTLQLPIREVTFND